MRKLFDSLIAPIVISDTSNCFSFISFKNNSFIFLKYKFDNTGRTKKNMSQIRSHITKIKIKS